MSDPETRLLMKRVAARLADLQQQIDTLKAAGRTTQLQNASLTDTALTVYGPDGETPRQYVGAQGDGTMAVVAVNGPPPPAPSIPQVFPAVQAVAVGWDGLAVDQAMPADFDHVDVHVSQQDGFVPDESTKRGTLSRAGEITVTGLDLVPQYVRLIAVSTSGTASDPSGQATATPAGALTEPDTTVPSVPELVPPLVTTVYRDATGTDRARVELTWNEVTTNTDGTPITDGSRYEIQYRRTSGNLPVPSTWGDVSSTIWADMASWGQPLPGDITVRWSMAFGAWGTATTVVNELAIGVEYEFQIRAVDTSGNASAWSSPFTVTTVVDTVAPSTPAAPTVAGSKLAIQVVHNLARDGGQPFSLESDLHHLEIHMGVTQNFRVRPDSPDGREATAVADSTDPTYLECADADAADLDIGDLVLIYTATAQKEPSTRTITQMTSAAGDTTITIDPPATAPIVTGDRLVAVVSGGTKVGELKADAGTMIARLPVIGTFPADSARPRWLRVIAVDIAGNKSNPSAAATTTADLIDSEFISELTASKISAGTLGADVIVGARIKTGDTGARVEMTPDGLQAYNNAGERTVDVSSEDGNVEIVGTIASGKDGARVVVNPPGTVFPEVRFYSVSGENTAYIQSFTDTNDEVDLIFRSGTKPDGTTNTLFNLQPGAILMHVYSPDGAFNGGGMELTEDYAFIGWSVPGVENAIWLDNTGVRSTGKFSADNIIVEHTTLTPPSGGGVVSEVWALQMPPGTTDVRSFACANSGAAAVINVSTSAATYNSGTGLWNVTVTLNRSNNTATGIDLMFIGV